MRVLRRRKVQCDVRALKSSDDRAARVNCNRPGCGRIALVPTTPILQSCVVRANGWYGNIRRFQNLSCGDFQRLQDCG